ncbi:calmodulin binding protein PICBP [Punica granatum]|uniref:Calmodulin-binding domain-containing protein n=2 Tax=Punica granatum TaxID=22663 RepID=A0A218X254_PUNGR|nr:calmodulin binding protein PICBP [Punica granatum]OWM78918.1 hypothetical protein CDL15_Pgr003089 [Punica granatum]PKI32613.1 hypothetical protein CRG98_047010 [Punica granatum]
MGSSARGGESDSEKLLLYLSSDSAGSERSTPMETSDASASYAKTNDALLDGEADGMKELMGALTRRRSLKVAKGLTRMSSLKPRRPTTRKVFSGSERKKKLKKLRSIKLVGPASSSSRRQEGLDHDQLSRSRDEADVPPNYLKATRSSDVKKVNSQPSPHKSECSISSSDGEGKIVNSFTISTARNKPVIAFRRTASLRPVRILAKVPSLKPKRPSTRKCSDNSKVSDSSVHSATCSSAIKGSKFLAQVENQQAGDVSEKISAMKVCPYSYCSLHGHHHAAPTLKRLKSARKRVKNQRSKKLDVLSRSGREDFEKESSHDAEKVKKELTEEINCRKDAGSNADDGRDRVKEVAEKVFQEKKEQSRTADPPVAREENLCQAFDSSLKAPANQKAHEQRESAVDILESINAERKEKEESGEGPGSRGRKFVSIGTQTDLELEEWGNDYSVSYHIENDHSEEISEAFETVQETEDENPPASGELSHGDSTSNNEQPNSSKAAAVADEEEVAGAVVSVFPTEELGSAHAKMEENLGSPEEPKEALPDLREEPISVREEKNKNQESPGEPIEALSGSTGMSLLACKTMDENLESPRESEPDSTSDDSFKSSFGRRKFNDLWYLIYQHMVSDVAENGGIESPVHQVNKDANLLPGSDRDPQVANHDEAAQQEELQQSDAIKLLQEAISKILEQSQDQCLMKKSSADNINFDKKETGEDRSIDHKSEKEPDLEEEKLEALEVSKIEAKREGNAGGRPNQMASKRWSNLKKYILMKRFIKAVEKTKNFSRRIQRFPSSEVYPEQEKVNLRRQQIGERKIAEEWMLDRALQKVISKLDPAQKRGVAFLVEAFETVNPVAGGKTGMSMNASSPSNVNRSGARETALVQNEGQSTKHNGDSAEILTVPSDDGERYQKENENLVASPTEQASKLIFVSEQPGERNLSVPPQKSIDGDKAENRDQVGGPAVGRVQDIQREGIPSSNSQLKTGNDGRSRKSLLDSDISRMCVTEDHVERTAVEVSISSALVHDEPINPTAASKTDDGDVNSIRTVELTEALEKDGEALVGKEVVLGSPHSEECRADEGDEPQSEKKKYTGLWYLIYKHMASGLATEQGSEPIDPRVDGNRLEEENEEEESRSVDMPSSCPGSLRAEQDGLIKGRAEGEEMKLRKIEAVKLVQQALDEMLLECEDSSPHDRSNTSNGGVDEQESKENSGSNYRENSLPASTDTAKDGPMHFGKVKENKPLPDLEIQLKPDDAVHQEEESTDFKEGNKSNPRSVKNWNNLRKMILLSRFVKALEKVRNFNPQERGHLPLDPDRERERVNLKHQDMDGRKNAEEYLLDYALQRVVSRLTPARKQKVHLLVEAFETVTPPLRK